MPLRVIDEVGNNVLAWMYPPEQWEALRQKNAAEKHLRMPCCRAAVILRRSPLGTLHFAHARVGSCEGAPETPEHLFAKHEAAMGAMEAGWSVTTEAEGVTPQGEKWIADVLAEKGSAKVAFEIQWSHQTLSETLSRQERYVRSGIRGMWFMRSSIRPGDEMALPVLRLDFAKNRAPVVLVSSGCIAPHRARMTTGLPRELHLDNAWIPLREFVKAALTRRYRYSPLLGCEVPLEIYATPARPCASCSQPIRAITHVLLRNSVALQDYPNGELKLPHGAPWLQEQIDAVLTPARMRELQLGGIGMRREGKNSTSMKLRQYCTRCQWSIRDHLAGGVRHVARELIESFPVRYADAMSGFLGDSRTRYSVCRWWFIDETMGA